MSDTVSDVFDMIGIKREGSLHLDADQSSYTESLASRASFDDRSMLGESAHGKFNANRNIIYPYESKSSTDDALQKKEEKPIVHRNTGKISVENYRHRRHRLMSHSAQNPNRRFFKINTYHGHKTPKIVTTPLRIEPFLPHTSANSSIQTSSMSEENVVVLSDDEENDVEMQQQQQQNRSPPAESSQIPAAMISAIFNAVQKNAISFQQQRNIRTPVRCDVCNQTYASTNYLRKHELTIKHKKNLQT